MKRYLETSKHIDWDSPQIIEKARELSKGLKAEHEIVNACFEYVRDIIKHSNDYKLNPVTCKASDALKHKTGYCYAKSHLLAALLRANKIPAGLCYQRLTIENEAPPFCLHGLNAVYLNSTGWYRIDARGNREGVNAKFSPPKESLAFSTNLDGEFDFKTIYSEPLVEVVDVLTKNKSFQDVACNLPDITHDKS